MRNDTRHFLRNAILALVVVVFGFVFVVPIILSQKSRGLSSKVSRVRTDQRSLAAAIESYYNDNNCYPAWAIADTGPGGAWSYNFGITAMGGPDRRNPKSASARMPSFMTNHFTNGMQTLTTPLSYITTYPPDPFAPERGVTFMYWSVYPGQPRPPMDEGTSIGGVGWILVSAGPDRDYDLEGEYDVYDPAIAQPSVRLVTGAGKHGAYTYDPTNGALSSGDVWRVKQ